MSEQNLETVRAAVEDLNRDDPESLLSRAAPEFEFDQSRGLGPNRGVFGLAEARGAWDEFTGAWEEVRIEPNELIPAGDDVVMPFTGHLRGRDGIQVQARGAWVWTLRDGLLRRICLYQERGEALRAVGLEE